MNEPTDTNIQIDVTYDSANDQIIYMDESFNIKDPGITEVAYKLPTNADIYAYDVNNNLMSSTWDRKLTSNFMDLESLRVYRLTSSDNTAVSILFIYTNFII